tara:strand:+ start:820 stop:1641 length:822 start_codon:yes stop_codon:yes gene_type:complete
MANWETPNNSDPVHVNVLQELADKDTHGATMGQSGTYTNRPEGFMIWDNVAKLFKRLTGAVETVVTLSLSGGGTGANDAAGVRTAINVNEAGAGGTQARTNAQADAINAPLTRSIATTSPLQGGGTLESDKTLSIQDATTGQKGATQLNNTLTSTSTAQALTAAQGKALKDLVDGKFQSQVLGTSGALTGGSCKVARAGDIITISGSFTHASITIGSSNIGYIPLFARPSVLLQNVYFDQADKTVFVNPNGTLTFSYTALYTETTGFSISYTI